MWMEALEPSLESLETFFFSSENHGCHIQLKRICASLVDASRGTALVVLWQRFQVWD